MPDLKAAANRLRGGDWTTPSQDKADRFLAAQALEALAWAENQKQPIECVLGKWRILGRCPDGYLRMYHADTPLGAILAAMEGEKDGN